MVETCYALLTMRDGAPAACHSCCTLASSSASARDASAANSSRSINCASAHTAAPRTSGLASPSNRRASSPAPHRPNCRSRSARCGRSGRGRCASPAILANRARNAASSRRARSASGGARSSSRAASLASRPGLRELVPGADGEAIVAAVDAVADRVAEFARDRALVLDGKIGDAAPRIELVGRGKCRGRADVEAGACRSRNDRSSASSRGRSSVVKIAPRNSHEPNSRDTRLVCLPCQPRPAACASGFSITAAVSTNTFTSPPASRRPASAPAPSAAS